MIAPVRAGGQVNAARAACLNYPAILVEMLVGTDLIVLLAGLGGGAGSAVTPIMARLACDAGAVTLAAAVKPFEFEGAARNRRADAAINRLLREADLVMAVSNEEWANRCRDDTPLFDVFDALDRHIAIQLHAVISRLNTTTHRAEFTFAPDCQSV